jgi:hypothetical protein
MAELWKAWKAKNRLPSLSTAPWKSRQQREIPTFPQLRRRGPICRTKENRKKNLRAGGKVEIQKQDFHFPTAPISLRRKERIISKTTQNQSRLHKTLDTARDRNHSLVRGT